MSRLLPLFAVLVASTAIAQSKGKGEKPAKVDVCAMAPKAEIQKIIGPLLREPSPNTSTRSLLGSCLFMSETSMFVTMSARRTADYEQAVKFATRNEAGKPVKGLGAEAMSTELGLLIRLEGKPYFLTVLAGKSGTMDHDTSLRVAKALKL